MPTYTLSKQPVDQAKVSVGGVFSNIHSQMYSESPFEKAVTNRDSKDLLSNSKGDGATMPLSFWTFSYATSAVEGNSQVITQKTGDMMKIDEHSSAAQGTRCLQNPFLPNGV